MSVQRQRGVEVEHVYQEAAMQVPSKCTLDNLKEAISKLPKDRIVAWVDGDDWLADRDCLSKVQSLYDHRPETWCSWGSYMCSNGEPGISGPYASLAYRKEPWLASHLKTFRAGLFQRAASRLEDLKGAATDMLVMLPMLEMSGREHGVYVQDLLYIYHQPSAADPKRRARELEAEAVIRAQTPFEPLKDL